MMNSENQLAKDLRAQILNQELAAPMQRTQNQDQQQILKNLLQNMPSGGEVRQEVNYEDIIKNFINKQ